MQIVKNFPMFSVSMITGLGMDRWNVVWTQLSKIAYNEHSIELSKPSYTLHIHTHTTAYLRTSLTLSVPIITKIQAP